MQIRSTTLSPQFTIRPARPEPTAAGPTVTAPNTAAPPAVDEVILTNDAPPTDDGGDVPVDEDAPPPPPEGPARAHGVLRRLAAGEFKGVADARLRLNFADEIAASGTPLPEPAAAASKGRAHAKLLAAYRASQPAALTPDAPESPITSTQA